MTVEELGTELGKLIPALASVGFKSIDPGAVEKLDKFAAAAGELGMKEGKHLLENLSGVMKSIQEGKSTAGSGNVRLTALEFYINKLSDSKTEDL